MKKSVISIALATVLAVVVGCSATTGPVSMRGAAVTAPDSAPEAKTYLQKVPGVGGQQLIVRTFVGQPPLVPHSIEKYVPLTADDNGCLECHVTDELRGQKMPKMSLSHFSTSLKESDGSAAVDMARFQCDSCHVPQVDAKPLVENRFVGVTK